MYSRMQRILNTRELSCGSLVGCGLWVLWAGCGAAFVLEAAARVCMSSKVGEKLF